MEEAILSLQPSMKRQNNAHNLEFSRLVAARAFGRDYTKKGA
jgi:hypothetical protein